MIAYHATIARNIPPIRRKGILASKSQGKRQAVWLVMPLMIPWAILHVCCRHKVQLDHVRIVCCNVPDASVKSHMGSLYYILGNVLPSEIVSVSTPELAITDPAD